MDSYIIHIYRRKRGDPQAIVGTVEVAGVKSQRAFRNLKEMCEILLAPVALPPATVKIGKSTLGRHGH